MKIIRIYNRKDTKYDQSEIKKLPILNKAALQKLLGEKDVKVITDESVSKTLKVQKENAKKNWELFQKTFDKKTDYYKKIKKLPEDENPYDIETLEGKEQKIFLINKQATIYDAIQNAMLINTDDNKHKIYHVLYDGILDHAVNKKDILEKFMSLQKPSKVKLLKGKFLRDEITSLLSFINGLELIRKITTGKKPLTCNLELGTGSGSDSCYSPARTTYDTGLLHSSDWPLKHFNTCVRNQVGRGTCVAFGTIAAVESAIAVNFREWVNLSEQDLYKHFKLDWLPNPSDYYGDGYGALRALNNSVENKYVFSYERDWNYNPSRERIEDDAEREYSDSCAASGSCATVGDNCSDTNHQARRVCYRLENQTIKELIKKISVWKENIASIFPFDGLGEWIENVIRELTAEDLYVRVCVYETTVRGTSGYFIAGGIPLFDASDIDNSLLTVRAFLAFSISVTICFHSVPSYKNRNLTNGYATIIDSREAYSGDHCVLLTGYVSNSGIPENALQASGGGYFIIKNSWGTNYGDCGYSYLPYDWVKEWCTQLVAYPYVGKI